MALILGPVIGNLGGGIDTLTRDLTGISGSNVLHEVTTITVPAGRQKLIAVEATRVSGPSTSTGRPQLMVGGTAHDLNPTVDSFIVVSSTTEVAVQTRHASASEVSVTVYSGEL